MLPASAPATRWEPRRGAMGAAFRAPPGCLQDAAGDPAPPEPGGRADIAAADGVASRARCFRHRIASRVWSATASPARATPSAPRRGSDPRPQAAGATLKLFPGRDTSSLLKKGPRWRRAVARTPCKSRVTPPGFVFQQPARTSGGPAQSNAGGAARASMGSAGAPGAAIVASTRERRRNGTAAPFGSLVGERRAFLVHAGGAVRLPLDEVEHASLAAHRARGWRRRRNHRRNPSALRGLLSLEVPFASEVHRRDLTPAPFRTGVTEGRTLPGETGGTVRRAFMHVDDPVLAARAAGQPVCWAHVSSV